MGREKRKIKSFLGKLGGYPKKEAQVLLNQEMPKLTEQEFALYKSRQEIVWFMRINISVEGNS